MDKDNDSVEDETENGFNPMDAMMAATIDQKPLEFQDAFNDLLQSKIQDGYQARKLEIAADLAQPEVEPEAETELEPESDETEEVEDVPEEPEETE